MSFKNKRFQYRMKDFIRQTKAMLLATLCRLLDYAEAEEVMQDAYLKVFIALEEGKAIEPRPYLFRVAKNMAISRLRHKKIESKNESNVSYLHELQISRSSTEQQAINAQQKLILLDAVNTLPPICRQIFVMRKIEEKSHSEIAEIMNVSTKTVENHLAKGMQFCRKYMMNNAAQQSMNSQTNINKA